MASSRDVGGPRLVGRIIDPLALDGADEPQVELSGVAVPSEGEVPRRVSPSSIAEDAGAEDASDPAASTGHPVRDRLLAKARMAESARGGALEPDHSDSDSGLWPSAMDELERVATRRAPSAPPLEGRRGPLPANLTALFGALFGLAAFAAVFAVLIHIDPRDDAKVVAVPPGEQSSSEPEAEHNDPEASEGKVAAADAPKKKKRRRVKQPGPWRITDNDDASLRKVEGTVGREPFLRVVQDAGVPKSQAYRLLIAFKGLRDFDKCGRTDRFVALIDRASKKLKAFEYIVTKEEVYQAREGDDGLLQGKKLDLKVERARVQGALVMTTASFSEAAEAAGFEEGLDDVVDEALDGHASVQDFRKGDRLRVVAQEVTVLGEFSRYAGVEAIEWVPRGDKKPLRVYYFRGSKSRGYYDASGRAPYEGGWRKPIKNAPVTSKFNPKRMHPVLNKVMPHNGTDFGAPMGTPVGASSPGVVKFVGYSGASGNLVMIDHSRGYETGYAHLSRFEAGLKVGDRVDRLQTIGYVGSTGRSTGPHLHFSAKKDGKFIDAESLQLDALRVLPKDERAEFAKARAKFDKLLDAIPLPAALQAGPDIAAGSDEPEASGAMAESGADDGPAADDPDPAASEEETVDHEEPAPRAAAPAPKAAPSKKVASNRSLYLTDRELMEQQALTDDGEVEE